MAVYFIQEDEDGPIKIGVAVDVDKRLAMLQIGNSRQLRLLAIRDGGRALEIELHKRLGDFRIRGEWFEPSELVMGEVFWSRDGKRPQRPPSDIRMSPEGFPIFPAYRHKNVGHFSVFCVGCHAWHHHGTGTGHKSPHCWAKIQTDLTRRGYVLEDTGLDISQSDHYAEYRQQAKRWRQVFGRGDGR